LIDDNAAVIERDELVFRAAIERKIPIVMLLSGTINPTKLVVIMI
jgi:hypothetical protein